MNEVCVMVVLLPPPRRLDFSPEVTRKQEAECIVHLKPLICHFTTYSYAFKTCYMSGSKSWYAVSYAQLH